MSSVDIVELKNQDQHISFEIHKILFEAYSVEALLIGVDHFPPLDRPRSDIAKSSNRFFGAFENRNLVAVVELECDVGAENRLGISALCVAPSHARKGIGSALINFTFTLGAAVIEVSTASANAPAIALYEKMGFRIFKKDTVRHGISIVHLERQSST